MKCLKLIIKVLFFPSNLKIKKVLLILNLIISVLMPKVRFELTTSPASTVYSTNWVIWAHKKLKYKVN